MFHADETLIFALIKLTQLSICSRNNCDVYNLLFYHCTHSIILTADTAGLFKTSQH